MHTQIGKWGNSLAVRIPGTYAKDLDLKEGMDLEVSLVHPDGVSELYLGQIKGPRIDLATDAVMRTAGAKDYAAATRLYGLVEDHLLWDWPPDYRDKDLPRDPGFSGPPKGDGFRLAAQVAFDGGYLFDYAALNAVSEDFERLAGRFLPTKHRRALHA